jgi:polysaccharide pyruvyl transferase CsaB
MCIRTVTQGDDLPNTDRALCLAGLDFKGKMQLLSQIFPVFWRGSFRMAAKKEEVYRIGISGSYGGLNLGDEAILQSIIDQLRAAHPVEITVFSRNPEDTLQRHSVERSVAVRRMSRNEILPEIRRLDLFILGGGGILFDAEAHIYLREVFLARENGVPVMFYAIGVGPLRDPQAQDLVRQALEGITAVTVRDRGSQKLLEEIGVAREVLVTADPALLMAPEPLPQGTLEREDLQRDKLIGMSVREPGKAAPDLSEERYHELLANAADFMVDRFGAGIVFVPMERHVLDMQHCHAVVSKMLRAPHARVLRGHYNSGQLLSLVSQFDFVVGMRLHFLIFAALSSIPFVALPYASKVHGFLDEFKIEAPPLKLVNAGRLLAHIDQCWDRRRSLEARIERTVPKLKERARKNQEILSSILSGRAPKGTTS